MKKITFCLLFSIFLTCLMLVGCKKNVGTPEDNPVVEEEPEEDDFDMDYEPEDDDFGYDDLSDDE